MLPILSVGVISYLRSLFALFSQCIIFSIFNERLTATTKAKTKALTINKIQTNHQQMDKIHWQISKKMVAILVICWLSVYEIYVILYFSETIGLKQTNGRQQ